MDSILNSVKKALGPSEGYEYFDPDLIMFINSSFSVLTQLGVGPEEGYSIESADNVWSEFVTDIRVLGIVKEYVIISVKLLFDAPQHSSLIDVLTKRKNELEWRLNVAVDPKEETT